MPAFEKRRETSQGSSSEQKDTRFLYKNRGDNTPNQNFSESSLNAEKPNKGSSSTYWNPRSLLRLGMRYLEAYGRLNGGNTVMPDHSGSAFSTLNDHQGQHTSSISSHIQWNGINPTPVQWNGANPTSDAAPSPTSDLSPALSHQLKTLGIGDLSHEDKPLAPSSDKRGHQEETSSRHRKRDVARPSSDERGHQRETRKRDLPPAELCQEALNNQQLVEGVLNNTDFIGKVLNNKDLMQLVLTNKPFAEAVFGNQTFVDTVLANKDFVNKTLNKKDFVNNAINSESWANWALDPAKRYGSIAASAVLGAAAAVVIGRRIRGSW